MNLGPVEFLLHLGVALVDLAGDEGGVADDFDVEELSLIISPLDQFLMPDLILHIAVELLDPVLGQLLQRIRQPRNHNPSALSWYRLLPKFEPSTEDGLALHPA